MAKPIISSITPFDVANGTIIRFSYSGEQPYSNKIIIYRASDLQIVYEDTESTMQMRHTIPAGLSELVNGTQYAIEVICYDNDGVASAPSNKVFFWCLTTPDFYFTTIEDGAVYDTSSITASVLYYQVQGDNLASYKFTLCDNAMAEVFTTGMVYDTTDITYTFKGLDNASTYYVRCEGISKKGVIVDTGYVEFFINFEKPTSYALLYASERDGNGVVDYYTNLIIIEDRSGKQYEYSNSMIILDDDILTYDFGFLINGDFTMALRHIYANGTILRCENDKYAFELAVVETEIAGTFRYRLKVPNSLGNYILYSEPFIQDELSVCTVWIRRINNVYQIKFFVNEGFSEINNLWIYDIQPISGVENYDLWLDLTNQTSYVSHDDIEIWRQDSEPMSATNNNIWIGGGDV